MPRLEAEKQENGSLTGVKSAGEGSQGLTGDTGVTGPVSMATGAFGEGASNASRQGADAAVGSDSFGDMWSQIKSQTSFDTDVQGGEVTTTTSGGGSSTDGGGRGNSSIVEYAKRFLGTPYVWGGTSPSGFDCSGFTQYVMKRFGINLPRVSYQQGQGGSAVGKNDLRPGDMVFWDNSSRNVGADHVGIYIGGGKYIHEPQPGESVKISSLGGNYWARRYNTSGGSGSGGGGSTRQRAQ